MKEKYIYWQAVGFGFTTLAGTLLHFLYDWTKQSIWAAPFSGINESTWEHMKLLFWPMFAFSIFQHFFFKKETNYWQIKLAGTLVGLVLIPVLFYTYNGALGKSPDWINIAIFYISAAAAYFLEYRLLNNPCKTTIPQWLFFIGICLPGVLFIVFTFQPPSLPIFQSPI